MTMKWRPNNWPRGIQDYIVIALGGNSILRANYEATIEEQYVSLQRTSEQLLEPLASENCIVITNGNGLQVGKLFPTFKSAKVVVPATPLDSCGAATQGFMGYMLQNTLANALRDVGLKHNINHRYNPQNCRSLGGLCQRKPR